MLKLLSFSLLILHCNCVPVLEVGGRDVQQKLDVSNGVSYSRALSGVSSLGSLGVGGVRYSGLQTVGVQPIGVRTVGVQPIGVRTVGVQPIGVRTVGVQPIGVQTVGVQPIGVQTVGVQPIGVRTVGVQPVAGVDLSGLSDFTSIGVRPVGFGVGFGSIGGLRTSALNLGVSQVGVRPVVQSVAVQPALGISTVGVNAVGVGVSQQVVPVKAAVQQVGRTVEYRPVPYNDQPIAPQVVEVEPSDVPLQIHFKSRSSTIQLSQEHIPGAPGTVEKTQSQDEPSKVVHEVVKPVIQEVREVITPYRQVVQEIRPVVESVHTVVAKGEGERKQFVAQPFVQNVQPVQAVHAVQPAVAVQAVAQPVAVAQAFKQVSQPVFTQSFQSVAQPVVGFEAVRSVGVHQPVSVAVAQQPAAVVSVAQPVVSRFAVSQPAVVVGGLGSGSFVSSSGSSSDLLGSSGVVSGLVGNRVAGVRTVGTGQSFFSKTQTVPQLVSYQSKTTLESDSD